MVKGKLIENKNYYNHRRKQLILSFLSAGFIGISQFLLDFPFWLTAIIVFVFIGITYLSFLTQRSMQSFTNNLIEIDNKEIRIKSNKGALIESFDVDDVNKIIVKEDYTMPQDTIRDMKEEVSGRPNMHYIELESNKKQVRIDFELETYYMIVQLKKVINIWKQNNLTIETT